MAKKRLYLNLPRLLLDGPVGEGVAEAVPAYFSRMLLIHQQGPRRSYEIAPPRALPPAVLDVREPTGVQSGRIKGAIHVPLGELEANLDKLTKERPIVPYCAHGERDDRCLDP